MFGVEDVVWANPPGSRVPEFDVRPEHTTVDPGSPIVGGDVHDEIRQGDDPDRPRRPVPAGLVRLRDRITFYARRMAPKQVAIGIASLVVVAFVAGVLVGRGSSHPVVVAQRDGGIQAGGFNRFTAFPQFPPPTVSVPDRVAVAK